MRISGKKNDDVIKRLRFDFSFRVEVKGFSSGIWVLWRESLNIEVILSKEQRVVSFSRLFMRARTPLNAKVCGISLLLLNLKKVFLGFLEVISIRLFIVKKGK